VLVSINSFYSRTWLQIWGLP